MKNSKQPLPHKKTSNMKLTIFLFFCLTNTPDMLLLFPIILPNRAVILHLQTAATNPKQNTEDLGVCSYSTEKKKKRNETFQMGFCVLVCSISLGILAFECRTHVCSMFVLLISVNVSALSWTHQGNFLLSTGELV